ncbi:MAG TPA: hypothetical protein H9945_01255 [Candidatus Gemmiger avicola]|uniref:RNA polymerase sigma-70 region 4 domain-containing protein n=1 Tax=Candidatus Gemmiger avicola TaxID=2838605 RepID=A0A9D2M5D0_9FIRM|nr:hypothetical protein [Candidatus Gemmiger avicola]
MPMTYAEKIRWLRRYGDARRQQRVLEKEIEALRSDAERVTPLLGALPGGAGEGGRVPRAVEAILEAQEQLRAQCDQCAAVRAEVEAAIARVPGQRDQEILRRRYILGQKWEQIAVEMVIDLRWIYRMHKRVVCNMDLREIDH